MCILTLAINCLFRMYYPGVEHILDKLAIRSTTAATLSCILILTTMAMNLKLKDFNLINPMIVAVSIANSLAMLVQPGGIYGNPSISGSLIVVTLPFFPVKLLPIPIIGILLTGASFPLGGLALFLLMKNLNWKYSAGALALAAITAAGAANGSSGRFELWRQSLQFMADNKLYLFGAGPGTSNVFLPLIQQDHNPREDIFHWFMHMHNDFIQVLFEYGIVGLASVLILLTYLVIHGKELRQPLLLFMAMSMGNSLMSFPIHALVGVVIATQILVRMRADV